MGESNGDKNARELPWVVGLKDGNTRVRICDMTPEQLERWRGEVAERMAQGQRARD